MCSYINIKAELVNLNRQESEDVSAHQHLLLHLHPPLVPRPRVPQLEAALDIFSTHDVPLV